MARTARPAPETISDAVNDQSLAKINAASQEVSAAAHLAMQQGDLYRIVGRIEAAHFVETVSSRMIGEAYLSARSVIGKLGSVAVRSADGSMRNVSSLEDFCEAVMPVSHRRCQQIAQAMHTLGPALYEQAEAMGLGYRNYVAIRALPNDMQDEVKAAIQSGDRDQVLKLIEELAARNASLSAKADELLKTAAAKDRVIAKKDKKLNELAEADERRRNGTPNEREKQQVNDLRYAGVGAELALQRLVAVVDEAMNNPATEAAELQARQTIEFIAQRLADLCADRGIAVDVLGERVEPGWRREIGDMAAEGQRRKRA
jgi:uncharacterized protein (DUF2164 family)